MKKWLSYLPLFWANGVFEFDSWEYLQQDDTQTPQVNRRRAARVCLYLHPSLSQTVLKLGLGGSIPICLNVLDILKEARWLKSALELPPGPTGTIPTPNTNLVSFFETEAKVDEFEALVISTPENVAWLQVSMDIPLSVEEGQSLQDISGTVLNEPHRVTLLGSAEKSSQYDRKHYHRLFLKSVKFFFEDKHVVSTVM